MNDKVPSNYIELTAGIVSAYVSKNAVEAPDISSLISQVHSALLRASSGAPDRAGEPSRDRCDEVDYGGLCRVS
jgi:predicted transcriptional regulator